MATFLQRLRERSGELWWWSAIIFLSCRLGDAINAFIGLWLVPRYVPPEELGAALPLIQAGGMFGLPLAILVVPFSRWLTIYATRGEKGKIKRLLSIAFYGGVGAFALAALSARFILPLFFARMRVAEGSLGFLIVCSGLLGPVSTIFVNALQGLKKFRATSLINVFGAPARLVAMLVTMPFRALSGYVAGQMASPALNAVAGWFALRRELGRDVRSVPLGRDVRDMARYALPFAGYMAVGTILGTWQALLFRQRLPEVESAAYYMITRLAEIASYAGTSMSFVVFPLAVEARERGDEDGRLLAKLLGGTLVPGLCVAAILAVFGRAILGLVPLWRDYTPYAGLMAVHGLRMAIISANGAFLAYETAAGRFGFIRYWLPLTVAETGGLVALTGCGAFAGILPQGVIDLMAAANAGRLGFFVWWLLAFGAAQALAIGLHIAARRRRRGAA